ncbi:glycosyltransferase [Parasphingorhabdus halotolerans]|uniref:Glycosyltransferase n=1 Tax=Parasphingorhabdus halotolerans TaxID=2725558 RepID=A0A6H2DLU4_9SPHN|nr:glycosyltransferase [Parasphingorhabdus halotolerans]QJB69168.1 glycosyltransferase [Parasphingorhabdus halotolerans]
MIVHFLYEPGDGGLDRVAILLANGMANRGLPVELWLVKDEGATASLIDRGKVKVRILPTSNIGSRGFRLFRIIPALARMIREHKPRAILSAGNQSNLVIALAGRLAGRNKTAIIQKITNPIRHPNMPELTAAIRKARFEWTARLGDMCLVLSKADADAYRALLPKASEKFQAVRNAYVTDEMLAIGRKRKQHEQGVPILFLAVGRLVKQKYYEMMLRALAQLSDIPWTLTILGDGPLREVLKALASRLGIADQVRFTGFTQETASYYSGSDILLLSSRWEGFPAAPLEALASGCDIVMTDCAGGLNDILHDLGYEPVAIDDDEAFAKSISYKISNPSDPKKMIEIAMQYSIEASVDDHLRLIDEIRPV